MPCSNTVPIMKRPSALLFLPFAIALLPHARAAQVRIDAHTFTVPDGFTIERVATTTLAPRPVSAGFDDKGRLYVTDSSGSNEKPSEQLKNPTHRVLRLEDTDGDGAFDQSSVFADKVMFPQGCLWHDGSVFVAAPPSIWKFTDTNGDGVADKREEWFKGGTLTGCANDIHGPYAGPDGYLYWTKGAFDEQTHTLGNGRVLKDRAAHIYRARPDGSDLDVMMTGGMDNPVGVAFTPEGEVMFTSTFIDFSQPGYRDGIGHAILGGVFGKANNALDDGRVRRTGPELLHPFVQFGAGAPSGLCRYESAAFGEGYRDNLFASLFNLRKITRHAIKPAGASYASVDSDFVVSDNLDFHPTDVLPDADGSLLIIDTGGWYKLCCPSSQLAKADVLGGIYRVRRTDAPKREDPRGIKIAWSTLAPADLVKLLDDARYVVRERAIAELARHKQAAIPALASALETSNSEETAVNTVWALARIASPEARQALYKFFTKAHPDERTSQVAIRVLGLWRDAVAVGGSLSETHHAMLAVFDSIGSQNPFAQRVAVEAIARSGAKAPLRLLVAILERPNLDPILEHTVINTLIELADAAELRKLLASDKTPVRRAALIALEQVAGGNLRPSDVTPALASQTAALKDAALWLLDRHPDWSADLAAYFEQQLRAIPGAANTGSDLARQMARHARSQPIQALLASTLTNTAASSGARATAAQAMTLASLKDVPAAWLDAVAGALTAGDKALQRQSVAAARSLPKPKGGHPRLANQLMEIARDDQSSPELRLDALAALPGGAPLESRALFDFVLASLDPAKPVNTRSAAAAVMTRARLSAEQRFALADAMKNISPLEMSKLLALFEKATDEALGLRLVAALQQARPAGMRADLVKAALASFPASVQERARELLNKLNADAGKQQAHLEALLAEVRGKGDVRRGQVIFNSAKAACSACHAIGYQGGKVGPDLTRISEVRSERDLLEAIVLPSASFVRSYEPMIVATKDGEEHSGVLRREDSSEVLLATGPTTEMRIARADITEMRPGAVSTMPQGLDEQLTRQELADLVAFLRNTKWGAQ